MLGGGGMGRFEVKKIVTAIILLLYYIHKHEHSICTVVRLYYHLIPSEHFSKIQRGIWGGGGGNFGLGIWGVFASSPRDFLGFTLCPHLHLPIILNAEYPLGCAAGTVIACVMTSFKYTSKCSKRIQKVFYLIIVQKQKFLYA